MFSSRHNLPASLGAALFAFALFGVFVFFWEWGNSLVFAARGSQYICGHIYYPVFEPLFSVPVIGDYPVVFLLAARFLVDSFGGLGLWSLRFSNLVFSGLAGIALVFLCLRLEAGRPRPVFLFFAPALFLLSPLQMLMINSFHIELAFPFLVLCFWLLCTRSRDTGALPAGALLCGLLFGFALHVKQLFPLYIVGFFLHEPWTRRANRPLRFFAFAAAAGAVWSVLGAVTAPLQTNSGVMECIEGWLGEVGMRSVGQYPLAVATNLYTVFRGFVFADPGTCLLHMLFFGWVFSGRWKRSALAPAVSCYAAGLFALMFLPEAEQKIYYYYPLYVFLALGAADWLARLAAQSALPRRFFASAAGLTLLCFIISLGLLRLYPGMVGRNFFYMRLGSFFPFIAAAPRTTRVFVAVRRNQLGYLSLLDRAAPDAARARVYVFLDNYIHEKKDNSFPSRICAIEGFVRRHPHAGRDIVICDRKSPRPGLSLAGEVELDCDGMRYFVYKIT